MLGSYMAKTLPGQIQAAVTSLQLPPQAQQFLSLSSGRGGLQQLFDPAKLDATRAQLPPQAQPVFDQVLVAIRQGLATTLSELFVIGVAVALVAMVVSVFLEDIPLRRQQPSREAAPAFAD